MELIQLLFGIGIVFQSVGCIQPFRHSWLLFVCQMIQHVSTLVDLAALDRCRCSRVGSKPSIPWFEANSPASGIFAGEI